MASLALLLRGFAATLLGKADWVANLGLRAFFSHFKKENLVSRLLANAHSAQSYSQTVAMLSLTVIQSQCSVLQSHSRVFPGHSAFKVFEKNYAIILESC